MSETSEKQAARLRESNRALAVRDAFDRCDDYVWHDSDETFAHVNLGAIEVSEGGVVDEVAVRRQIRHIAQRRPWLVVQDDSTCARIPHGPSGGNVGSRRRFGAVRLSDEEIRRRFPALR